MVDPPKFVLLRFKFKSLSSIVSLVEFSRTEDSKMCQICSKVVAVRAKNKLVSVLYTATSRQTVFLCTLFQTSIQYLSATPPHTPVIL